MHSFRSISILIGVAIAGAMPSAGSTQPAKPVDGATLSLSFGGGWTSNPDERSTRERGDATFRQDITLGYRWQLWEGASASLSGSAGSTFYAREHASGTHRLSATASFSQSWREATFTLALSERTAMNSTLSAHDSASREIGLSASRTFTLREGLTLSLFARGARRFHFDGTEDQLRASMNATLAQKMGPWTLRLGGGFSYALEDKTPLLPRINDRSVFANVGLGYEWAKDREISLRASFWRTYSSYPFDRYKAYSIGPGVSASWQF